MFAALEEISARPEPFEFYTARDLWADDHVSRRMLEYHLNETLFADVTGAPYDPDAAEFAVIAGRK